VNVGLLASCWMLCHPSFSERKLYASKLRPAFCWQKNPIWAKPNGKNLKNCGAPVCEMHSCASVSHETS